MTTLRVCLLAALLVPAVASAKKPADKEPAAKHVSYDDADEIEGGTLGPDGNAVNAKGTTRFSSLVKVRTTFVPELIKSAQNY
jgi:hypothetical protein